MLQFAKVKQGSSHQACCQSIEGQRDIYKVILNNFIGQLLNVVHLFFLVVTGFCGLRDKMCLTQCHRATPMQQKYSSHTFLFCRSYGYKSIKMKQRLPMAKFSMCSLNLEAPSVLNQKFAFPVMVNSCTGKMGRAVAEAAVKAGLQLVPVTFGATQDMDKIVDVGGTKVRVHDPSQGEHVLSSVFNEFPDVIVVDYTLPSAVNANADLYCKLGVPFVMGTTGGDRERLYKTVQDSNTYAVISPQMGKQVVAFLATMEIMAKKFPGVFSGYTLQVMESHQAGKADISGTAKVVISCFQKMGVKFQLDEVQQIRDPKMQVEMVGVPEEHLSGHAFHMYHLASPDQTVSFEFQHNVCGRSIYAEGSIDAAIFLSKKVQSRAEKHIFDMIDVLEEGNVR